MWERLSVAIRILVPLDVMHRQPLLLFLAAAVIGIVVESVVNVTALFWVGCTVLLIALSIVAARQRLQRRWATIAIVLIFLPLAALWHNVRRQLYESASIGRFIGEDTQPTILEGIVNRPVVLRRHPMADQSWRRDQSPWQSQLEVRLNRIRHGLQWGSVSGRVLVMVDGRRDELRPGDSIRVFGSIERFGPPGNPGEQDFRDVYRQRNIHARVRADSSDQIQLIGQSTWRPGRWIASLARLGRERLMQYLGPQTGPLAIALVIGQREFVGADQRDRLLVTGTVHLLSVSGLHLAIIVVLAHWAATLLRFPPTAKFVWILGVCLLYTAVTGARPPVVRAAVLVTTFMIAYLVKRPSQPINTLSLAALVILVWNPSLVFGIGVQLSFLAVATLLLCRRRPNENSPAVAQAAEQEERMRALAEKSRSLPIFYARALAIKVWHAVWYSCCVTAISMPLVWYQFHVVSPISVLANVVLSPALFVALATGVATVVFGWIDPLGTLLGTICGVAIGIMRSLIDLAASIPLGHFWLPAPPTWWVVTFYAVILVTLYLGPGKLVSYTRYGWIATWAIVAWMLATSPAALDDGSIEATFIDVGHGTSIVLRSDDRVWLYDCGRLGNDEGRSQDIDAVLWSLGVTHLDGIFLSHADADHFNALPGILQRFEVNEIVTPPDMLDEPEPAVVAVRGAIEQWKIEVREVASGAVEKIGQHTASVLHPPIDRVPGTDNANSMVLRIDCGSRCLILPGDLEPPGTGVLINHPRPPAGGVLMAPHHGSLRMDAATVLQWSRPAETVVSGGWRAKRPEVTAMLSASGSGVYVTSQAGAIRVVIDRTGPLDIRSWLQNPW